MKPLKQYIAEATRSTDTTILKREGLDDILLAESLENINEANVDSSLITEMTQQYINLLGENNILDAVRDALENKTNNILDIFNKNSITEFVNGQMLGRIIEKNLASGRTIGGFAFRQGSEGRDEKDIECVSIGGQRLDEKFNEIIGNVDDAHNYGIELKCTQGSRPVGNKSYAIDVTDDSTKKMKQSFYIIITNIKWGKGTANLRINSYNVYFAFLQQKDWVGANKGNSASIRPDVWKSDRIIQLM